METNGCLKWQNKWSQISKQQHGKQNYLQFKKKKMLQLNIILIIEEYAVQSFKLSY